MNRENALQVAQELRAESARLIQAAEAIEASFTSGSLQNFRAEPQREIQRSMPTRIAMLKRESVVRQVIASLPHGEWLDVGSIAAKWWENFDRCGMEWKRLRHAAAYLLTDKMTALVFVDRSMGTIKIKRKTLSEQTTHQAPDAVRPMHFAEHKG